MEILQVHNLTKRFGGFTAVDGISFSLKKGEILGLLGPNGAGKTTTIQMLLAVLTPTAGDITYFGKNLNAHREEILERVNFSSTYTGLPSDLTVRENLTYISYLYDIKNRKERIEKVVSMFKVENLFKKPARELSAGELTKINLIKAFLNFPQVLLLDEPTASLDPEAANYVRDFLLHEQQKFNTSIIITSHNMAEVEEVCDRVIIIDKGKIVANDTPGNLAKSMEICHIEFLLSEEHQVKLIEYCREKNIQYKQDGRYSVIDVREKDIPYALRDVTERGIAYDEISIEKPTLEDYFLKLAQPHEIS